MDGDSLFQDPVTSGVLVVELECQGGMWLTLILQALKLHPQRNVEDLKTARNIGNINVLHSPLLLLISRPELTSWSPWLTSIPKARRCSTYYHGGQECER